MVFLVFRTARLALTPVRETFTQSFSSVILEFRAFNFVLRLLFKEITGLFYCFSGVNNSVKRPFYLP
jgi:hypothetical protein